MTDDFQRRGYLFLALRGVVDLALMAVALFQSRALWLSLVPLPIYCVFYGFLAFAIRNERFPRTRRGSVGLEEPWAYWSVFSVLVLMHLAVTGLFASLLRW